LRELTARGRREIAELRGVSLGICKQDCQARYLFSFTL
jgi:hypothetical protein